MHARSPLPGLLAYLCIQVDPRAERCRTTQVAQLYKEDTLGEVLRESGDIAQRRQNCAEMRTLLRSALQIVTEVRDYNAFK